MGINKKHAINTVQGRIQRFWKGGEELCLGHHCWPAKKVLNFRWSKKAKITLETISFWKNIYISIFKFFPLLSIKSYQFFNALIRKDKQDTHTAINEKRKTEKSWALFLTGCFIKLFKMIINHFFLFIKLIRSAVFAFWYQGYQKGKLGTTNSQEWQIKCLFKE